LDSQEDGQYAAYKERAAFFNATARTAEGYVGLIFRRPTFIKIPESGGLGSALSEFVNDADLLGTPLVSYAKNVIGEVISVGRCGTLIDWEGDVENRVYVSLYSAENILNWRVERINGCNIVTMADIIAVNLDHYRLDADYKHVVHFTALPTAWVSGFDKSATLIIGSSTAWVTETPGAAAGFLEFTGQGLKTFERAMDRDEHLLAVLGSRLLEGQKKVGETAQAIGLCHFAGENQPVICGSKSPTPRWLSS
jgi:Domain of unknown function (DUF4055)